MREAERPRRILLALDLSPESRAAAEAAVDLARALRAEIEGLFVEDLELLSMAQNPSARQVDPLGGAMRQLEPGALERRLRVQAERARGLLERSATSRGVSWSFRVVRGRVAETLRVAATSVDWVALGRRSGTSRTGRLGSAARAVLSEAVGALVTSSHLPRPKAPLVVLYDGSPAAERAARMAASLTGEGPRRIDAFLLAAGEQERDALRGQVEEILGGLPRAPLWISTQDHPWESIAKALGERSAGLLLLPAGGRLSAPELEELIATLELPVFLVR